MFKIIVAGGRDFKDYALLEKELDWLLRYNIEPIHYEPICILCGMAHGADMLGRAYAQKHGYKYVEYPAKWHIHGKRAGFIRNEEMAKDADALVAFWDGKSRGTKDMIDRAYKHGLQVSVIRYGDKHNN